MVCEFCENKEVLIEIISDAKRRIGKDVEDLNLDKYEIISDCFDSLEIKCKWCGNIQNVEMVIE